MAIQTLNLPAQVEDLQTLRAGDLLLLSGTVYVARDAAHRRMAEALAAGRPLPFPVKHATVYYMGPTPARPGAVIGSAGPTTATRMDAYTPELLDAGLRVMIGKGKRSEAVKSAMRRNGAVYFAAAGGAGALLSKCIVKSDVIAYEDLGPEAIRKLEIKAFPAVVVIDAQGTDAYEKNRRE